MGRSVRALSVLVLSVLVTTVAALVLAPSAFGAPKTFDVTSTADTIPNGCSKAHCTLREATIAASAHPGQLASNGGPTKTVALKKGSPAIGKAGSSPPKCDQRGVKRDAKPDIGAYERRP